MSEFVIEVNELDFDEMISQSQIPIVVDFWAPWCGPCRTLAPVIEATARKYGSAVRMLKLNVDTSPAISARYNIRGIPTMIVFVKGVEKERIVGIVGEEKIAEVLDRYIDAGANNRTAAELA